MARIFRLKTAQRPACTIGLRAHLTRFVMKVEPVPAPPTLIRLAEYSSRSPEVRVRFFS